VDADDKSSSGLATLDGILGGGFARQRIHLIEVAPGSGVQFVEPLNEFIGIMTGVPNYTGPRTLLKTGS